MTDQLIDKWGEWIDVSSLTAGDSDVYIRFTGTNASHIKGGKKNPLYGKRVNLTVLYGEMMDDVIEYIQSDEFLSKRGYKRYIADEVCQYTTKKYGVTLEFVYNRLFKDNNSFISLTTDKLFQMMIDRVGGVEKIDWVKIFNKKSSFVTGNEFILIYIAREILKGSIYKYFVDRFNFRVDGVKTVRSKSVNINNKNYTRQYKHIVLKWEIDGITKEREIGLAKLIHDKRDWWQYITNDVNRGKIRDYDKFLDKRDESEVLPDRCSIDNNIILNYTCIDFSGGNQNMQGCKNNTGLTETWSMASIDRIDSTKEYDYDNIQIISHYYNMLKGPGSFEQISKLYRGLYKQRVDRGLIV